MMDDRSVSEGNRDKVLHAGWKNRWIRFSVRALTFTALAVLILVAFGQPLDLFRLHWIAYLGQPQQNPEVWRVAANGKQSQQLTFTGGQVIDFSVSADGKWIAYSVENSQSGSDLYFVRENGKRPALLVECAAERCDQPAWSADGKTIAYRRQAGGGKDLGAGSERIWLVEVASGESGALFDDTAVTGRLPAFSPDGTWLAYYDTSRQAIHLYSLRTAESQFFPSQVEEVGSFSPDGSQMAYVSIDPESLPPAGELYLADLHANKSMPLFIDGLSSVDTGIPVWAGSGEWIAFSIRPTGIAAGRQLWVVRPDGSELRAVTDDSTANHAAASWSHNSSTLILQRLRLGSSDAQPDILSWDLASGRLKLLVENGALPVWMR